MGVVNVLYFECSDYLRAAVIKLVWQLGDDYLRAATIRGRRLIEEIRYLIVVSQLTIPNQIFTCGHNIVLIKSE